MRPLPTRGFAGARLAAAALLITACTADGCSSEERPELAEPGAAPASEAPAADAGPAARDAAPSEEPGPLPVPLARYGPTDRLRITSPVEVAAPTDGSMLLIVVDALNAGHLGCYGYGRPTSPGIDRLAGEGVLFTDWVSNSSWTRPSYTTIITGWPKRRHGVELGSGRLGREHTTIAQVYRAAGFRTAGFVGNPLVRGLFGFDQGFEVYEDTADHGSFPRARVLVDKTLAWLERVGDQRFFALVFLTDPHTPYRPPRDFRVFLDEVGATSNIEYPLREYVRPLPEDEHRAIVAAYDGEVAYADHQIGRLLDGLETLGLRRRTTVAVTADHGEIFGEHNCYLHSYHMWEPVLRVPFILSSPSIAVRGVVEDRPYTHLDVMPTLLRLSGIAAPEGLDGRDWAKDLENPGLNRDQQRRLYSQYNAHGVKRQALRQGRWKLVHHHQVDRRRFFAAIAKQKEDSKVPRADPEELPSLAFDGQRYELYDLVADPGELVDLFGAMRDEAFVREMVAALGSLRSGAADSRVVPELSEETLEALRAAGYIR